MIQITFQPALDPLHSIFRVLRLLPIIQKHNELSYDQLRVLDFYLVFPFRIDEIRLAPEHRKFKKLAKTTEHLKPYGRLPDSIVLFERMAPIQMVAVQTLCELGYFSASDFNKGVLTAINAQVPTEIKSRIDELNKEQEDIIDFLFVLAGEYSASGKDGLKSRTGLIEYRYDKI